MMKREVRAGVDFLVELLKARGKADEHKVECFGKKLMAILCRRYTNHWYPANPSRGQAFRSILISSNQSCDESVLQAFQESELDPMELGLPRELILWIDPFEVSARSGDKGHYFTVAQFEVKSEEEREADSQGDTSDYHSANSSDHSSETSSDNEGEKETPTEGKTEKETPESSTDAVRTPLPQRKKRKQHKAPSLQCIFHPTPVWLQYGASAPLYHATVYHLGTPLIYYCIPSETHGYTTPQFIIPQVALQPYGVRKGLTAK